MIANKEILDHYGLVCQPIDGWDVQFLSNYGFSFTSNEIIRHNISTALTILNATLPQFYYLTHKKVSYYPTIIIEDKYVQDIAKTSKMYTYRVIKNNHIINFTKSIIDYSGFLPNHSSYSKGIKDIKYYKNEIEKARKQAEKQKQQSFTATSAENNNGGIYGIYSLDENNKEELLYIGLTQRSFQSRFNEHKNIILGNYAIPIGMEKLYRILIKEYKEKRLIAKPLIEFDKIQASHNLTKRDKEAMELALINYFKPIGNTSGIDIPYKFSCDL